MKVLAFVIVACLLVGCNLQLYDIDQGTRPSILIASATPDGVPNGIVSANYLTDDIYDALPVMSGICFEAAWDAAERVFILRSAHEHILFYNLADNSGLCRQLVIRHPFDFSNGDVLAGMWNRGVGCTASHEITEYTRDDTTQTITIHAQFSTEGTCPYQLVRGFWLGIENAQAYAIHLTVEHVERSE